MIDIQGADRLSSGAQKVIQLSLEVSPVPPRTISWNCSGCFGVIDQDGALIGPQVVLEDGGARK